jgi:hypothetical protein
LGVLDNFFAYSPLFPGGVFVAGPGPLRRSKAIIATGAGAGGGPEVRVLDARTAALRLVFDAYDPRFPGGVRVAVGNVTGSGVPDIVTAPGPGGGPDIKVFNSATGAVEREFMAYNPAFTGGVFVAVGDIEGTGIDDIVTGAGGGGTPEVKIFSGRTGAQLADFLAFDISFTGGVRVAVGDVNGDGHADIIAGAGPGGTPLVNVFSGANGALLRSFNAYNAGFRGGVFVAAGDVNGDHFADIITGAGAGGGPQVNVYSGIDGSLLSSFFAFDQRFPGGVRVAAADVLGDGKADIIAGAGPGGGPEVVVLEGDNLQLLDTFFAYSPQFPGGVFVGAA